MATREFELTATDVAVGSIEGYVILTLKAEGLGVVRAILDIEEAEGIQEALDRAVEKSLCVGEA